uniref:hydantoinase/oxoprolinase family protein n=1 Tax=Falsiroseomonas oryzae TaxID=2766473 RepID=UPI0022EB2923
GRGGTHATVTDANVVLGRLGAGQTLGGTLAIDGAAARVAVGHLAARQGIAVEAMAAGIVALAVAKMAAAIYEISVARGRDPRDYALVPFGGAGPLHACEVAAELGIPRVLVPPSPGTFSAFGALCSPLIKDRAVTLLAPLDEALAARMHALAAEFAAGLRAEFAAEGTDTARFETILQVDARYLGQAHELTVVVPAGSDAAAMRARFEAAFSREYGRLDGARAVEIVNLRVIGRIGIVAPAIAALPVQPMPTGRRALWQGAGWGDAPVYRREALASGAALHGPAIVEEMSATLYLPPAWTLQVGPVGELDLRHEAAAAGRMLAAD